MVCHDKFFYRVIFIGAVLFQRFDNYNKSIALTMGNEGG